jgi:outer membrane protein, heavy metal efflux system
MVRLLVLSRAVVIVSLSLPLLAAEAPVDLPSLIARAKEHNPEVRAAYHAWKVAQADVSPAAAWPDPTFSVTREKYAGDMEEGAADRAMKYAIEQPIPFPGKLTQDSQMKHHESLIAEAKYRARLLDIVRDLRLRYYQLYLVDRQISLAHQSVEALRHALQTAQNRLASGKASALDVFMAQTELHKMENALYAQRQQRRLVSVELNTLLNQPTEAPFGAVAKPALEDVPVTTDTLRAVAAKNAPEYQRALHEINHSRTMRARSRLAWAPDFSVMAERETPNVGASGNQLGARMTFPLWLSRPWGLQRAATAHELEAAADAQAMKNMTLKMVDMETIEVDTHLTQARRFEATILPAALSALRTARQQYASGQGDFLRFLEALRSWLDAHNQYEEEVYHYGEHWSELSRWIGVEVSQAKDASAQALPEEKHHAKP